MGAPRPPFRPVVDRVPHADHGAIFGETVFHGGDLIGKCNFEDRRRETRWLRCPRLVSGPGFERIELMLEVRERLFQSAVCDIAYRLAE